LGLHCLTIAGAKHAACRPQSDGRAGCLLLVVLVGLAWNQPGIQKYDYEYCTNTADHIELHEHMQRTGSKAAAPSNPSHTP
jgi:hypothetical protein